MDDFGWSVLSCGFGQVKVKSPIAFGTKSSFFVCCVCCCCICVCVGDCEWSVFVGLWICGVGFDWSDFAALPVSSVSSGVGRAVALFSLLQGSNSSICNACARRPGKVLCMNCKYCVAARSWPSVGFVCFGGLRSRCAVVLCGGEADLRL